MRRRHHLQYFQLEKALKGAVPQQGGADGEHHRQARRKQGIARKIKNVKEDIGQYRGDQHLDQDKNQHGSSPARTNAAAEIL